MNSEANSMNYPYPFFIVVPYPGFPYFPMQHDAKKFEILKQKKSEPIKIQIDDSDRNCQMDEIEKNYSKIANKSNSDKNTDQNNGPKRKKNSKRKLDESKNDKVYNYPKSLMGEQPQHKKEQIYTRKNVESNVIIQLFSFLWSPSKSKYYISKFYKGERQKIQLFYDYFKIIEKVNRKYWNREYLKDLCNFQQGHIGYKTVIYKKERLKYLSVDEFSAGIKYLIKYYLQKFCITSILTSKKMSREIWRIHLRKCRILDNYFFGDGDDSALYEVNFQSSPYELPAKPEQAQEIEN